MKATAIALLVLLCLGLGFVLIKQKTKATQDQDQAKRVLQSVSEQLVQTSTEKTELMKTNSILETNLALRIEEVLTLSNDLALTSAKLYKTEADFKMARQSYLEDLAKREQRIAELETQRDDLNKRVEEVGLSLATLEAKIAETQKKLASSEGDRSFLLAELKKLQAEKKELERKFDSLTELQKKVRQLKNELAAAIRLDWVRKGIYSNFSKTAGERLTEGYKAPPPPPTNGSLKVEFSQDGTVKVIPPKTNAPVAPPVSTNRPPAK